MRRRTRAREIAVQFLYQLDLRGDETQESLHEYVEGETTDKEMREFAIRLIQGSRRHQEETDARLCQVTRNWDLSRMATLDRNSHPRQGAERDPLGALLRRRRTRSPRPASLRSA